ncbi:hypothetical protein ACQPYK_15395 [Streptosporangium sp. CA-135522]|uniref:hypothetical protein n=1 Tax=Streptosporangium sp. CA-135522 TaxID=3240072 RepID=UPI003D8FC007
MHTPDGVLEVEAPEGMKQRDFLELLRLLDGSRTIEDLKRETGLDDEAVREVVEPAVVWGLVDDGAPPAASSGLAVLSRLEDTLNRLLEDLVFAGPFWWEVSERPQELHRNVFFGFGLENWFFLFRENEFDSAVLALAENAELRSMLNDFYQEEHRHDDIVVRAFRPLGITRDDLLGARPLPTTTALIRMLSWWARTDPLFFVATIGVLEGRLESGGEGSGGEGSGGESRGGENSADENSADGNSADGDSAGDSAGGSAGRVAHDSFLAACDRVGLDPGFVEPMRAHARVNAGHDHGSVSRELFARVPGIDRETERRWQDKAHLFMEAYAAFFNGILEHYSDPRRPLLRTGDI